MKKLGLLVLFATSLIHAQLSTLEKCGAGACYGFGPPTGAAANGYIYQDVSQSPPVLSCAKNGAWVSCGGVGASFPASPSVVVSTSTTTSRNAFASDITGLFPGTGPCFLKSDGTCAQAGTPPAGTTADVQLNGGSSLFGADTGNFTYTSGSHTLTTVNQAVTGFFDHASTNISNLTNGNFLGASHRLTSNSSAPSDTFGNGETTGLGIFANNWGIGKNVANAFSSDPGWRVLLGEDIVMFGGASGIHQGLHIDPFVHGSGDSAVILEGNGGGFSPCMWTDLSGEGCVGLNINGTQQDCIATGTIGATTGTGDTNPTFNIANVNCNGAAQLINDGIIIDTSITKLHTNLTGTASGLWESNPFNFGSLAVTAGTAVLSTGICITTADIPVSTVWGTYQTQSLSCTTHDGLPVAVGPVLVASPSSPEQCNVLTYNSGTGAGTISCAKFHPSGSYIFQGGLAGTFGDFDDDLAQNAFQHSVLYVLGATDTSHVIIAQRQAGLLGGTGLPYVAGQPAGLTLTGGFTVHPGALCVNTNSTNTACTLELNNVAWRAVPNVAPITSFSITSNVVTILASNNFTAGESATIAGMGVATYLNGQSFAVLSAGLSPTQFEIAFTHANVGATADTGTATSPQHAFASPTGIPTLEAMVSLTDSQTSPDSPQSPGDGIDINFRSTTQHGGGHAFLRMNNSAALSKYANSGTGSGWLTAPPAIDVQGPMGNLLQFDMSLAGLNGNQVCNGGSGTLLCYKNSRAVAPQFNLFTDAQGAESIRLDGAASKFRFRQWGVTAPSFANETPTFGTIGPVFDREYQFFNGVGPCDNWHETTLNIMSLQLCSSVSFGGGGVSDWSAFVGGHLALHSVWDGTTSTTTIGGNLVGTGDVSGVTGTFPLLGVGGPSSAGHLIKITATGVNNPLLMVGGSGEAEIWKDATPTAAASFGLNIPGASGGSDFNFSLFNGSSWTGVAKIVNATGDFLIGTATDDGVNKLQVNGGIKASGAITVGGTGSSIATGTASNTDLAGQVTLVAGAGTQALTGTYTSAPIVVCSDTSSTPTAVSCHASTTTITINGTGTDVINYITIARN